MQWHEKYLRGGVKGCRGHFEDKIEMLLLNYTHVLCMNDMATVIAGGRVRLIRRSTKCREFQCRIGGNS